MVTYITAQYRHVVVCSGLYPVRSQSLYGGYSSGCIESAMQPSSKEKSSRTTLHYVIQNDSARDPPLVNDCFTCTYICQSLHVLIGWVEHWLKSAVPKNHHIQICHLKLVNKFDS